MCNFITGKWTIWFTNIEIFILSRETQYKLIEYLSFRETRWKCQFKTCEAVNSLLSHFVIFTESSTHSLGIFLLLEPKIHLVVSHTVVCNSYVTNYLEVCYPSNLIVKRLRTFFPVIF